MFLWLPLQSAQVIGFYGFPKEDLKPLKNVLRFISLRTLKHFLIFMKATLFSQSVRHNQP